MKQAEGIIGPARLSGFSLIELMVAVAVLCVLCALLFSLVSNATGLWRGQEAREEGFREARAALNLFSRDVENAVISTNTHWFHASSNRLAFLTALPSGAQRNADRGDVCAVGYSLEWGKINPAATKEPEGYALYRYVRFSAPTFAAHLAESNSVEEIFSDPDGDGTVRELLARNVVRVGYDLYVTNSAGGLDRIEPGTLPAGDPFPDMIGFSITTLNEAAAARLASRQAWENTNSPVVRENEQTFRLRVRLKKPFSAP